MTNQEILKEFISTLRKIINDDRLKEANIDSFIIFASGDGGVLKSHSFPNQESFIFYLVNLIESAIGIKNIDEFFATLKSAYKIYIASGLADKDLTNERH